MGTPPESLNRPDYVSRFRPNNYAKCMNLYLQNLLAGGVCDRATVPGEAPILPQSACARNKPEFVWNRALIIESISTIILDFIHKITLLAMCGLFKSKFVASPRTNTMLAGGGRDRASVSGGAPDGKKYQRTRQISSCDCFHT